MCDYAHLVCKTTGLFGHSKLFSCYLQIKSCVHYSMEPPCLPPLRTVPLSNQTSVSPFHPRNMEMSLSTRLKLQMSIHLPEKYCRNLGRESPRWKCVKQAFCEPVRRRDKQVHIPTNCFQHGIGTTKTACDSHELIPSGSSIETNEDNKTRYFRVRIGLWSSAAETCTGDWASDLAITSSEPERR